MPFRLGLRFAGISLMLPDLDTLDDMEADAADRGFDMLGRVLACAAIVLLVAPLIWWAA